MKTPVNNRFGEDTINVAFKYNRIKKSISMNNIILISPHIIIFYEKELRIHYTSYGCTTDPYLLILSHSRSVYYPVWIGLIIRDLHSIWRMWEPCMSLSVLLPSLLPVPRLRLSRADGRRWRLTRFISLFSSTDLTFPSPVTSGGQGWSHTMRWK